MPKPMQCRLHPFAVFSLCRKPYEGGLRPPDVEVSSAQELAETTFDNLDSNSDGSISKDEYYGLVSDAGIYPDRDSDSDGFIEENEFEGIGLDDDYASWDLNRNHYMDSREFDDGYFGYYDANEDGHWDGDEWDDAGEAGILDF